MFETDTRTPFDGAAIPDAPHATDVASLADGLGVELAAGLPEQDAADRLASDGRNELAAPPQPSLFSRFVAQFRSLLILVLVGAAALSAVVGEAKDAIVVGAVLLLNAVLGTVQEARAENSVRALQGMLPPRARVRRGGRVVDVAATELVAGDVVLLEAGDRVPADGRVVDATSLNADESSLTGETTPASKQVDAAVPVDAAVADQVTMLWMNTTVVRGRGELLVTATGMDTEIGRVARMLADTPERRTPLQRQIDQLGRRLAMVAAVAVAAVFAVALVRGDTLAEAALDAIALAIAAIPEGLPAVVTVTLALGTAAMARQRAIVKRLSSVETLGSTQVICTDKTGTLTRNQMTVRSFVLHGRRHEVGGEGYATAGEITPAASGLDRALTAMVLCNDADVRDDGVVGDPTEGALLVLAAKAGLDVQAVRARRRIAELPFDASSKLMVTVHDDGAGGTFVAVKGAPDVVLRSCTREAGPDGALPLSTTDDVEAAVDELGGEGLRTLGIATRHLPDVAPESITDVADLLTELTFELLVGIVDPPRPGVRDAIGLAHQAGIRVIMVTGDHPATAAAIAREIGITGDVMTGADLDRLDDEQLTARMDHLGVCARVAPEHKVRLVTSLQTAGLTTAMTGDGVNDAAALKRADIGIAMGIAGTEVTKEAGDLVLADDDFATIVTAVERGRGIYDNILSFVRFQVATNMGAIIAILGARLIGLPAPFTPIQVLWVNLIMDGPPALALGADPARPEVMSRPPRDPDAAILDAARLRRLLLSGLVMAAGTLSVFAWALEARPTEGDALATTLAFTTFVLFQFVNAVNARVEHTTVFSRHTLRNGKLWLALSGVLALQVAAVQIPAFGGLVDVVPMDGQLWLLAAATASSLLIVEEVRKLLSRA